MSQLEMAFTARPEAPDLLARLDAAVRASLYVYVQQQADGSIHCFLEAEEAEPKLGWGETAAAAIAAALEGP